MLGAGAVYVADGATVSYSSLSDRKLSGTLSVFDTRLHVLADGDSFDLLDRQPVIPQEAVAVAS